MKQRFIEINNVYRINVKWSKSLLLSEIVVVSLTNLSIFPKEELLYSETEFSQWKKIPM